MVFEIAHDQLVVGFYGHGVEPSGSLKGWEFLD
jgi:hypothetical protein